MYWWLIILIYVYFQYFKLFFILDKYYYRSYDQLFIFDQVVVQVGEYYLVLICLQDKNKDLE